MMMLLAGIFMMTSCEEEKATTGSLTIVAMNEDGSYAQNINLHLAKSLTDIQNKNYLKTEITNVKGAVVFHDLGPDYYWFAAENWDDYGSARVFSGIDHYVVLWLNNPAGKK